MKYSLFALITLTLVFSGTAMAASSKRISQQIDTSSFEELRLQMSVGEMDIEAYDGDIIELDIELRAERRWFSLRRGNVDDIELEQRDLGNTLYLGIDEDNLEQTWRVRLPSQLALELNVGVGDVRIDGFANSLVLELGVGEASVNIAGTNYSEITASAGVGDAAIRGFGEGADNARSRLVGADAHYYGDGEHRIEVEVGVGDVVVRGR